MGWGKDPALLPDDGRGHRLVGSSVWGFAQWTCTCRPTENFQVKPAI